MKHLVLMLAIIGTGVCAFGKSGDMIQPPNRGPAATQEFPDGTQISKVGVKGTINEYLYQIVDTKRGVTCYAAWNMTAASFTQLSCAPNSNNK